MYRKIMLDAPNIGENEKRYVIEAIDSGYVSTVGPFVSAFEERFAGYLGEKKAVSTQSGTSAIHMALYELGIRGAEKEVIVPALTFVATVNPVVYVGATPVFADIEKSTWNMDPEDLERKITDKTAAIIPVHLYGNPCDMDAIMRIAQKHGIPVVEDATESLGAKFNGKYTGTFGDFGCFSFNGNKIITTGGGGMIIGKDEAKMDHIKFLVNQARDTDSEYFHSEIGFNYRMTNIESALGMAQMDRLDGFLSLKKSFDSIYRKELGDIDEISFQETYSGSESSCWLSCICLKDGMDVEEFRSRLKKSGIPTRRVFTPVVAFPPYATKGTHGADNAYKVYRNGVCLPGSTLNSEEDIVFICENIRKAVKAGIR